MQLTVQMLVRDEAARLGSAIGAARSIGDEVIVGVDTASVDAARDIAGELADRRQRARERRPGLRWPR